MPKYERLSSSDYTRIASAMLAEVGMSFEDCYEMGRPWLRGPEGFQFLTGKPAYAGEFRPASTSNPHTHQRPMIGFTGPIDCEVMLGILAHECGHAAGRAHGRSSAPEYVQEYEAITYGLAAMRRHLGRPAHSFVVDREKKYLRSHCWARYRWAGPEPTKRWSREITAWCGFATALRLRFGVRLSYTEDWMPGQDSNLR